MTSLHPTLPTQTLVPGTVDPTRLYAGTIHEPYGHIVREVAQKNYSQPQQSLSIGDERHRELMTALKKLSVNQKVSQKVEPQQPKTDDENKTTKAMDETRQWRG